MKRVRLAVAVLLGLGAMPAVAQVYTRTDQITYEDNLSRWVIGQQKSVRNVETNLLESRIEYDAATALPTEVYAFEKLQQKLTYYADGNVWTASDGNDGTSINTTITLASWKRGIPQSITFGDANVMKARVDDYGLIRHVINEANAKTCYDFDAMGRLAKITYTSEANPPAPPAEPVCDTTYNPTISVFEPIAGAEYGIAGGHWRRTVTTGNGRTTTFYDAMWRPVLEESYDTAHMNATLSRVAWRYNAQGQQTFAAHPFRAMTDVASVTKGTRTTYDALGRPVRIEQDSEFATPIATTTKYLDGFLTEVTDPRGKVTTTSFFNHDEPHVNWPVVITAPEDQKTTFGRLPLGSPTFMRRSNGAGTVSQTRSYGYDLAMRLCKSIDSETGTTVYDYDEVGNVTLSASGLAGLSGTTTADCGLARAAAAASARRATRAYDERGRLELLTYADGKGSTLYTYWPDGLPRTVETNNGPEYPNPVLSIYNYNKRRLLNRESVQHDDIYWPYDYAYNANGHLAVNTWHGVTIDYAPNGRGQPTKAGMYATGVTYHPNGAMAQFTYGNGVLHTMSQNARGLPEYTKDAYGGTEFIDHRYEYDASGNVVKITDGRPDAPNTRTMVYDDANRLKTTISPRFSSANYAYDVLDNIAQMSIGGPNFRTHYYCYDTATWRLTNIKTTGCATGATVTGFGYDAQGNVNNKNGTLYNFDSANRLRSVTYAGNPVASYAYDGHGRRVWNSTPAGEGNSQYSQDGRLVLANDLRKMTISDHIQLNGSLLASRERDAITNIYSYKYHHTDAIGTPVSTTDQNRVDLERHDYEPYGKVVGSPIVDKPGYTGHVEDAATSLIYMQQRYYDAGVGRFLSVDPVAPREQGDNFNRYWYGNNSPYKFTDPDGRIPLLKLGADFKIEVGIQYAETGSADFGGAAVETLKGALDPSKTFSRGKQLASLTAKQLRRMQQSRAKKTRPATMAKNDGNCVYCGSRAEVQDHRKSIASESQAVNRGEKTAEQAAQDVSNPDNLVPACAACNGAGEKGARDISSTPGDSGWVPPKDRPTGQ